MGNAHSVLSTRKHANTKSNQTVLQLAQIGAPLPPATGKDCSLLGWRIWILALGMILVRVWRFIKVVEYPVRKERGFHARSLAGIAGVRQLGWGRRVQKTRRGGPSTGERKGRLTPGRSEPHEHTTSSKKAATASLRFQSPGNPHCLLSPPFSTALNSPNLFK